jgi:hypothetical protein
MKVQNTPVKEKIQGLSAAVSDEPENFLLFSESFS